jgi:hypothetical protein
MRKMIVLGALVLPAPLAAQEKLDQPELAFEEIVTLSPAVVVGETPLGTRQFIPITGGTFEGPNIRGEIIPGGWDWQLVRKDGCTFIEADYFLKTDDGVVINVVNKGALCPPKDGVFTPARTHPVFEAPIGKYDWLNTSTFVGTLGMAEGVEGPAVKITFYKVN